MLEDIMFILLVCSIFCTLLTFDPFFRDITFDKDLEEYKQARQKEFIEKFENKEINKK